MKKNLLKLGALAVALVVLFAACAQPVEETKSKEEDVIIRLFLDRPVGETLKEGDSFQIRVGTKFAIPAYLKEETYTFMNGTEQTITRYVWRSRVRGNQDESFGADLKSLIPLKRLRSGTVANWLINPVELSPITAGAVATVNGVLLLGGVSNLTTMVDSNGYVLSTDNISWVEDSTVPLLSKIVLQNAIDADKNPDGKAIYIGYDLNNDPNWGGIDSVTNPWFSVLDSELPQKGTPINPNNKYYETGVITLTSGKADVQHNSTLPTGGVPLVVSKDAYYVDLVLINKVIDDPLKGATLKKSVSAYLELEVLPSVDFSASLGTALPFGKTNGGMPSAVFYMYTKDKHGFNTWNSDKNEWNTDNANIKTLSLKPGINKVYLRYFSSDNASEEMGL
jgi:hypothetical protein